MDVAVLQAYAVRWIPFDQAACNLMGQIGRAFLLQKPT
jgi:hypothetical protein